MRYLTTQNVYNRYDINSIQSSGTDIKKFYLSEIVWTFANTKRDTSKNESFARTLYLHSSLCAPVLMGDQTTDLLRQIYYRLVLKGSYYYEPKQIQYIPLRNNYIDEIETQMSESENNNLAQFTDGTSIVTLHFRRVRLSSSCPASGAAAKKKPQCQKEKKKTAKPSPKTKSTTTWDPKKFVKKKQQGPQGLCLRKNTTAISLLKRILALKQPLNKAVTPKK